MKDRYKLLKKFGVWALDIFCVLLSYIISAEIRYHGTIGSYRNNMIYFATLLVLFVTIFNNLFKTNRGFMRRSWTQELGLIFIYNFYLLVCLVLVSYFLHMTGLMSRLISGYFVIIDIVVMVIMRMTAKAAAFKVFGRRDFLNTVIVLVEDGLQDETDKNVSSGISYTVDGYLVVDKNKHVKGHMHGDPIDTELSELTKHLVTYHIDNVFINTPDIPLKEMQPVMDNFEDMGLRCSYVLSIPETLGSVTYLGKYGTLPVVTYAQNVQDPFLLFIKRVADIIGALVGLVFTGIIAIFVVPAIKLDSPGPAIFSQIRVGKNGRRFKFYKFRSMYVDAEERKKELEKNNQMNGLMFKMDNDPRITRVGKFIRKTSLDEFPQFFNVLKGDMSLVGTRPPTEEEFEHYNEHYRRRLSMVPGITGLWQVSGRSDIRDFDDVVKLDLKYMDNWSLGLDARILFETFAVALKRKGAE